MAQGSSSNAENNNGGATPSWDRRLYVYPTISRRAGGVSIGINLNPDKRCNFNCVYCEVDRVTPPRTETLDLAVLENELREVIAECRSGALFQVEPFSRAPEAQRRLRFLTFSGDGEPTACSQFAEAAALAVRVRDEVAPADAEVVLITDSACLGKPGVRAGLDALAKGRHQIWAKLDAGTEKHYLRVNRSRVPFSRVLEYLTATAKERPLYVQSLFLRMKGQGPDEAEIEAYCDRINELVAAGGRILGLQLNTVSRKPPVDWAEGLADDELEKIAARIKVRTGLPQQLVYAGKYQISRQALA